MPMFTQEIMEAAIAGFEAQKHHIDSQIAELRAMLTGTAATANGPNKARKTRRKLSPEALERIREGQRRRWATAKGTSSASSKAPKPKRKLSAAGRKAIVAALKKRWAAKKAAAQP